MFYPMFTSGGTKFCPPDPYGLRRTQADSFEQIWIGGKNMSAFKPAWVRTNFSKVRRTQADFPYSESDRFRRNIPVDSGRLGHGSELLEGNSISPLDFQKFGRTWADVTQVKFVRVDPMDKMS